MDNSYVERKAEEQQMITCQICQHGNPEGAEYCENCGAALPAESAPASPTTPPAVDAPAADATTPADVSQQEAAPAAEAAGQTAPLTTPPDMDVPDMDVPDATAPADASPAPAADASDQAEPAQVPAESTPAAASTGQNPRIVGIRYGAPTGDEFPLLGQRLVVGRFDSETGPVDIDLSQAAEAEQISRQHAEIYREADGRWFVKDLGSTNGVFVKANGAATFGPRLTAPQALTNGDEIGFGNARFIFTTD